MQPSRTQRYLECCCAARRHLPSPIYGQLSDKPLLVTCILRILTWWDVKHNRDRELNRQAPLPNCYARGWSLMHFFRSAEVCAALKIKQMRERAVIFIMRYRWPGEYSHARNSHYNRARLSGDCCSPMV